MTEAEVNGLDQIAIKAEPEDPLVEHEIPVTLPDGPIIPKEFTIRNGLHDDSDCEEICYFTQVEVDNTRKCLENTRLIIKDFETQLDWHLQQYMTLRNIFPPKNAGKDDSSKRDDHLSIAQLSALIANHPEGNKKFIRRRGPIGNTTNKRKRNKKYNDSEEEDTDFSDEDSDEFDDEEDYGEDSEDADNPKAAKTKGKKRKAHDAPQVKDEIEEEEHQLIEPKIERESEEEEEEEEIEEPPPKKTPAKRGRKPAAATPAKKGGRGKKAQNMETVDLTNLKNCKVVLDRLNKSVDVKSEAFDKEELVELLKSKAITDLKNFTLDPEKPIAILRHDNVNEFDYNECKTSNVIVTFEDQETLPDFVFNQQVVDNILTDSIILVQAAVFDEHLEDKD